MSRLRKKGVGVPFANEEKACQIRLKVLKNTTKKSVKRKDIEKGLGSYKINITNYLQESLGETMKTTISQKCNLVGESDG